MFPKHSRYRILGIDPSMSNAGAALVLVNDGNLKLERLERIQSPPDGNMPVFRQIKIAERLSKVVLDDETDIPLMLCVEAPSYGAMRSETMHALFAVVIRKLVELRPFLIVTPTPNHLKMVSRSLQHKFGIEEEEGKEASKAAFSAAFPDHKPSGRVLTHDEAEAGLLALLANRFYNVATDKVSWDDLSRLERDTFISTKATKKAEQKGMLYREGEFFFLPKVIAGTKIKIFSREQGSTFVLGEQW